MAQSQQQERILIVESDPEIRDLIARQALQPLGYRIRTVESVNTAIQRAIQLSPDLIISNLQLPDLSGKDLLVALSAQGIETPVILISAEGMEADVIQAFRLDAFDFLTWPVREAEVVSAVERALKTVRNRRERERLSQQVRLTNHELKRRAGELATIFSIGKAVTSLTNQQVFFDKMIEGAITVCEADSGWLLIREEKKKAFVLSAYHNLPESFARQINQPMDDGISSSVTRSGKSLAVQGDSFKRFKISELGRAALAVPIKAQKEVIGVLVVLRKKSNPFTKRTQFLLEAVADYAAISTVNARLFRALQGRAGKLQKAIEDVKRAEKIKTEILQNVSHELRTPLVAAKGYVDFMLDGQMGKLNNEQIDSLTITQEKLQRVVDLIEAMTTLHDSATPQQRVTVDLNDLSRDAVERFQQAAKRANVSLQTEIPSDRIVVSVDPDQISQVFDHLITNSIKFSPDGGQVTVRVEQTQNNHVHVSICDTGIGIGEQHLPHIFEQFYQADGSTTRRFSGLGLGLSLAREIVTAHGGEIWVESEPGEGATFHFSLP